MAKNSWRYIFVDINKSITAQETTSDYTGFAVIRAPKGSTTAYYVPPKNPDVIKAMFGYGSADWPDIYEVLDFNNQYGVYISAPTVDVAEYPNYYGGVYLTSQGIVPMYRVTDKKSPNFEVGLLPGKESTTLTSVKSSTLVFNSLNEAGKQALIRITNIDSNVYKRLKYIDFDWPGYKGTFRYKLNKSDGTITPDPTLVTDQVGQSVICGSIHLNSTTGKYELVFGGTIADHANPIGAGTINTINTVEDYNNYKIPFIDFTSRAYKAVSSYDYTNYLADDETLDNWSKADDIIDAILNGGTVDIGDETLKYDKPLSTMFHLIYDISSDVFSWHVQPSPTANETTITLDSIVYDKYKYSRRLYYTTAETGPDPTTDPDNYVKTLTDDGYLLLKVEKSGDAVKNISILQYYEKTDEDKGLELIDTDEYEGANPSQLKWVVQNSQGSYELSTDTEIVDGTDYYTLDGVTSQTSSAIAAAAITELNKLGYWTDVTDDFDTDSILAFDTIDSSVDKAVHHRIYKVSEGALTEMTTDATDEDFKLQENVYYNSYHALATEEDSEGEVHTSGDFTGSLDEFGVDENNGDIYWQELIVPDESVVYAEAYVKRTFDNDLDEHGIYTGTRIAETSSDAVSLVVSGQRYVDYVVEQNIKAGYTGGNCTDTKETIQKKFARIIKEGLIEAAKPKYEDCYLFMEFTGLETVKPYFSAIRGTHLMASIVSPKNINQSVFNNMKTIKVTNRLRGSLTYCQEVQYKDKNLRKKYYACPIGAVSVMLMHNIEGYYGCKAPMWINEGDIGGQIEDYMLRSHIQVRWDFEDSDTKIMDQKGVNPIIEDKEDGVMIISQKTTELNAGDWSYIAHQMGFDLCTREIRDNVMKPQIGKDINEHYINLRQQQVNKILSRRTAAGYWRTVECDVASANTDYTRAQRMFVIPVAVRVNPTSEFVKLSFTNLGQSTIVSE